LECGFLLVPPPFVTPKVLRWARIQNCRNVVVHHNYLEKFRIFSVSIAIRSTTPTMPSKKIDGQRKEHSLGTTDRKLTERRLKE